MVCAVFSTEYLDGYVADGCQLSNAGIESCYWRAQFVLAFLQFYVRELELRDWTPEKKYPLGPTGKLCTEMEEGFGTTKHV